MKTDNLPSARFFQPYLFGCIHYLALILRQFDMAYAHFKARLGEMDGISHEEGEELMTEGREIVMAFSEYTAKLSKRIRFRYYTPREISEFMKTAQGQDVDAE